MKHRLCLFCLVPVALWCALAAARTPQAHSGVLGHSTQLIVVTTPGWNDVEGRLQRFERSTAQQGWHPVGEPIRIVVGRNGMGWGVGVISLDSPGTRAASDPAKREGDGKSPAGVFRLGRAFGYSAQPLPGLKMSYLTLTPSVECVDDSDSKFYNRIVDRSAVAPDWHSSEHMRDAGESYRWGIVVDHNGTVAEPNGKAPVPQAGSCVFLHIWHRQDQGTAGCTAMTENHLESLLIWLDPSRDPLLVQLTEPAYRRLRNRWKLPKTAGLSAH